MGWDYRSYLGDEVFRELNRMKAFHPEYIEEEMKDRTPVGFPNEKLVFAAADHNARMINEYKGNPIGLSNRREYITRLFRELQSDEVDGLEGTADVIEDIILLNRLQKAAGGKDVLKKKMLIGTVNRGGLKGSCWEMDDLPACYTVERLQKLHMDGVKFMIRINPDDEKSRFQLRYLADAVNECEKAGLPIFIETLYFNTVDGKLVMRTDSESLCKAVGVVSGLGCRGVGKWQEVPLNHEYAVPVSATTGPVLVVPDEIETDPMAILDEYTCHIGEHDNIRGTLLCRNIMYGENDPLPLCDAIARVWHYGMPKEKAYEEALALV